MAKFGMDDGYAVGPAEVVLEAVRMFAVEVREQCMLQLEWSKTELFSWDGVLPAGCPEGITLAGEEAREGFRPGFLCYGVPVGELPLGHCFTGSTLLGFNTTQTQHFLSLTFNTPHIQHSSQSRIQHYVFNTT